MRLLLLLLAPFVMAKHHKLHNRNSTESISQSLYERTYFTTVTVAPGGEPRVTVTASSSAPQLQTRDSGDLRTFRGRTRTVHVATTTTLPVVATFTATPSPSLLTTTEAITVTKTARPPVVWSPIITPSAHISTTIPSNLQTPLADKCYDTPGGVLDNGTVTWGCGGILAHIQSCYNAYEPGKDPVTSDQNFIFQACVCETSNNQPFTGDSVLYRNYTGCAACLLSLNMADSEYIYTAAQELLSFCRSQNPSPYLFFSELSDTLGQPQLRLSDNFIPSPALTLPAPIAVSTTQPLANLAYGASAPPDGSLAKVTPSLVTYTTSTTRMYDSSIIQQSITSLAAWVPTQVGKAWNAASASRSEAVAVSSRLASAICEDRHLGECPQSQGLRKRIGWSGLLACLVLVALLQLR